MSDADRLRILSVSKKWIIAVFQGKAKMVAEDLPEDCEVVSVTGCDLRRSVDVTLRHKTFSEVPMGMEPPRYNDIEIGFLNVVPSDTPFPGEQWKLEGSSLSIDGKKVASFHEDASPDAVDWVMRTLHLAQCPSTKKD